MKQDIEATETIQVKENDNSDVSHLMTEIKQEPDDETRHKILDQIPFLKDIIKLEQQFKVEENDYDVSPLVTETKQEPDNEIEHKILKQIPFWKDMMINWNNNIKSLKKHLAMKMSTLKLVNLTALIRKL
uniref:Uncharacterized protein n=1 Tax=Arion vulgaris TaxID=1028688 RepID=A0A0B7BPN2_9EUPU